MESQRLIEHPRIFFEGTNSHANLLRQYFSKSSTATEVHEPADADAVCIFERDPALHSALAMPHLLAGKRVFVDKPITLTSLELKTMLDAGILSGFSAMRWHPSLVRLTGATSLRILAPASPGDPGGWTFYAVHAIEMAQQLLGGEAGDTSVEANDDSATLHYALDGRAVHIELMPSRTSWTIHATLEGAGVTAELTAEEGFYQPACERILSFLQTAESPVAQQDMLSVVRVVEALHRGSLSA